MQFLGQAFSFAIVGNSNEPSALIRRHRCTEQKVCLQLFYTMSLMQTLSPIFRQPFRSLPSVLFCRSISSGTAPFVLTPQLAHSFVNENKKVSFLDASWFMPDSPRRPRQEFMAKRIPGAQFLDLDEVSSPHELGLKHMMPRERAFADACGMALITFITIYPSLVFIETILNRTIRN